MATAVLQDTGTKESLLQVSPADDDVYELVDGLRVEVPPMSAYSAKLATRLATRMNRHAESENLGEAIVESLFHLPLARDRGRNRRPDVAFVTYMRWPAQRPQPIDDNAWDVVPDIAIEVVSPHDLAESQLGKIIEYFEAGVRLVWVVYPRYRQVHVFESARAVRVLTDSDVLDGGQVLPGFLLPLLELFDPVAPPDQGSQPGA
jgi:Uma2 family endonuclease